MFWFGFPMEFQLYFKESMLSVDGNFGTEEMIFRVSDEGKFIASSWFD